MGWISKTIDRFTLAVMPKRALARIRSRSAALALRHYEAAQATRRTWNWPRNLADANATAGPALATLRALARDLTRNDAWARNAVRVIVDNSIGWGIIPKASGAAAEQAMALWKRWGETTECDADGRLTFYGLQALQMRTIVESGEVLVRRRWRRPMDELSIPMQLQVLEPDWIDATRDGFMGQQGGPVIQGIEYDAIGRRVAYWLWDRHPGSALAGGAVSRRIDAGEILHSYLLDRPAQGRGISWLAAAIMRLRDFDEYEDAVLMAKKIQACFAGFVTDLEGQPSALGETSTEDPLVQSFEPGTIYHLGPGEDVKFGTPPVVPDEGFSQRALRSIAAALGVTYEDLTGDFSQVNFSSARMGRLKHWSHVHSWRWNMLIPQLFDPAWRWAMEAAELAGSLDTVPAAVWTPPPMPMIEPDKEGLALQRLVRSGAMTFSEMIRQQGGDPTDHWREYAADLKQLDAAGIWLDSDVRRVSQAGLEQPQKPAEEPPPVPARPNGKPSGTAEAPAE